MGAAACTGVMTFFPSSDREVFSNTDDMRLVFNVDAEGHITELTMFEGEVPTCIENPTVALK